MCRLKEMLPTETDQTYLGVFFKCYTHLKVQKLHSLILHYSRCISSEFRNSVNFLNSNAGALRGHASRRILKFHGIKMHSGNDNGNHYALKDVLLSHSNERCRSCVDLFNGAYLKFSIGKAKHIRLQETGLIYGQSLWHLE